MSVSANPLPGRSLVNLSPHTDSWPELRYDEYKDTEDTLHLLTQMMGKLRMALVPPLPQWAHTALRVSPRGFTTMPVWVGDGSLGVELDLISHEMRFDRSDGRRLVLPLESGTIAGYYRELERALEELDVKVEINPLPAEIPDALALDQDTVHGSYDPQLANHIWQAFVRVAAVFEEYQSDYHGRQSALNFWWGGFDLSVTRFSGRRLEPPEGLGHIMSGALTAESIGINFFVGSEQMPQASFVAHVHPKPAGLESAQVRPAASAWIDTPGMFLLPYEAVRTAADPRVTLLEFCRSVYEAGATLAGWDREELEGRAPASIT